MSWSVLTQNGTLDVLSRPVTQQKRKLRIYISNTYTPSKPEGEEAEKVSSWELRVEGKLLDEVSTLVLPPFSLFPSISYLQRF